LAARFGGVVFVLCSLASFSLIACSPRHGAVPATVDSLWSASPVESDEDSLLAVEHELARSGAAAERVNELSLSGPPPAAAQRRSGKSRDYQRVAVDMNAINGSRREIGGSFALRNVLAMGLRSTDASTLGFLKLDRWRFLRSVVVGNMTLRMGERLVLGRGFTSYQMVTTRAVSDGMAASPSLSRWFGRSGVAVDAGGESLRTKAAILSSGQSLLRFDPAILWVSVGSRFGSEQLGLTIGKPLVSDTGGGGANTNFTLASLYAWHRGGMFHASGEFVRWLPGRSYFALTVGQRGSLQWSIRYFHAPAFSSSANPAVDPTPTGALIHGALVDVRQRYTAARIRTVMSIGIHRSASGRRRFRRAAILATGKERGIAWEGSLWLLEDTRVRLPNNVLVEASPVQVEREVRLRGKVITELGAHMVHTFVLDYRPGIRWDSAGLGVSVATRATLGRLQARWQVTAYSLRPGQSRFVTRPGIGTFEWFSTVYGRGSDVAMRVRWRLRDDLFVLGYYGEPWLKEPRAYVGMQLLLR
jgi:hypothetical protein